MNISFLLNTRKKRLKVEFIGSHSLNRGYHSSENMIFSMIYSRSFYRKEVEIILHNTYFSSVTFLIDTYLAVRIFCIGHSMTERAFMDLLMQLSECSSKIFDVGLIGLEQKKGEFRRSLLTNSRKKMYHINQSLECFWHSFLIRQCKSTIFENQKCGFFYIFHTCHNERIHDSIYRTTFSNTDIKQVFLKKEVSILHSQISDIISLCSILVEYPYIIDSQKSYHHYSKNVCLSKRKSKMLACSFSFRKE